MANNNWLDWENFWSNISKDKKSNIYKTLSGEALTSRAQDLAAVNKTAAQAKAMMKRFTSSQTAGSELNSIIADLATLGFDAQAKTVNGNIAIKFTERGNKSHNYTWEVPIDDNGTLHYNQQDRNNLLFASADEKGQLRIISTVEMALKQVQKQLSYAKNRKVASSNNIAPIGINRLKNILGRTTLDTVGGGSALNPYNAAGLKELTKALSLKPGDSDYKIALQKSAISYQHMFDDIISKAVRGKGNFHEQDLKKQDLTKTFQKGLLFFNTFGAAKGYQKLAQDPSFKKLMQTSAGQQASTAVITALTQMSQLGVSVGPVTEENGLTMGYLNELQRSFNFLLPQKSRKGYQTQRTRQNFGNQQRRYSSTGGAGTLITSASALKNFGRKLQGKKYDQTRMIGITDDILDEARKLEEEALQAQLKAGKISKKKYQDTITAHGAYSVQNGGMLITKQRAAELNAYTEIVKKVENRVINEEFQSLLAKRMKMQTSELKEKPEDLEKQMKAHGLSEAEIEKLIQKAAISAMKRSHSKDYNGEADLMNFGSDKTGITSKDSKAVRNQKALAEFTRTFRNSGYRLDTDTSSENHKGMTSFGIKKNGLLSNLPVRSAKYVSSDGTLRAVGDVLDDKFYKYIIKALHKQYNGIDTDKVQAFYEASAVKSKNLVDVVSGISNDLVSNFLNKNGAGKVLTAQNAHDLMDKIIGPHGKVNNKQLQSIIKNMFTYKSYDATNDPNGIKGGVFTTSSSKTDQQAFIKALPAVLYAFSEVNNGLRNHSGSMFKSITDAQGKNLLGTDVQSADDLFELLIKEDANGQSLGADFKYQMLPTAISSELALHDSAEYGSAANKGGAPVTYGYREMDSLARLATATGSEKLKAYAKDLHKKARIMSAYYDSIKKFGQFNRQYGFKNADSDFTKSLPDSEIVATMTLDELMSDVQNAMSSEELEGARSGSAFIADEINGRTYIEAIHKKQQAVYDSLSDEQKKHLLGLAGGHEQANKILADSDEGTTIEDVEKELASSLIHIGIKGFPLMGQRSDGGPKVESTTAWMPFFRKNAYKDGETQLVNYDNIEGIESFIRKLVELQNTVVGTDPMTAASVGGKALQNLYADEQRNVEQKEGGIFTDANKVGMPHSTQSLAVSTADLFNEDQEEIMSDAVMLSPDEYRRMLQPTAEDKKLIENGSLQWSKVLYTRYSQMYSDIESRGYTKFKSDFKKKHKDLKQPQVEEELIQELTNQLVAGATVGSEQWKKTNQKGDIGFVNRFPSIAGSDVLATRLFVNGDWKNDGNRISMGRYLFDLINGDVDGDMISYFLSGMDLQDSYSADFTKQRNEVKNKIKEQAGLLGETRGLTGTTKQMTAWMKALHPHTNTKLHPQNSDDSYGVKQSDIDELLDSDSQAGGAFASKFNKIFTGPYSNVRQRYQQGLLDAVTKNPGASDENRWAAQIFENFLNIPEQAGISSKKVSFKSLNTGLDVLEALQSSGNFNKKGIAHIISLMQEGGMLNDEDKIGELGLLSDDSSQERNLAIGFSGLEDNAKKLKEKVKAKEMSAEDANQEFSKFLSFFGLEKDLDLDKFLQQSSTADGQEQLAQTLRQHVDSNFYGKIVDYLNEEGILQKGSIPGAGFIDQDTILRPVTIGGRERQLSQEMLERLAVYGGAEFATTDNGRLVETGALQRNLKKFEPGSAYNNATHYVTDMTGKALPSAYGKNIRGIWTDLVDNHKELSNQAIARIYKGLESPADRRDQQNLFLNTKAGTVVHEIAQDLIKSGAFYGKDGELINDTDFTDINSMADWEARLKTLNFDGDNKKILEDIYDKRDKFIGQASALGLAADDPRLMSRFVQSLSVGLSSINGTASANEIENGFNSEKHRNDAHFSEVGIFSRMSPSQQKMGGYIDLLTSTIAQMPDYDRRNFRSRLNKSISTFGDEDFADIGENDVAALNKKLEEIQSLGAGPNADEEAIERSKKAAEILDDENALQAGNVVFAQDIKTGLGDVNANDASQVLEYHLMLKKMQKTLRKGLDPQLVESLHTSVVQGKQEDTEKIMGSIMDTLEHGVGGADLKAAQEVYQNLVANNKDNLSEDPKFLEKLLSKIISADKFVSQILKGGHVWRLNENKLIKNNDLYDSDLAAAHEKILRGEALSDDEKVKLSKQAFEQTGYTSVKTGKKISVQDSEMIDAAVQNIKKAARRQQDLQDQLTTVDLQSAMGISLSKELEALSQDNSVQGKLGDELRQAFSAFDDDDITSILQTYYNAPDIEGLFKVAQQEAEEKELMSSGKISRYKTLRKNGLDTRKAIKEQNLVKNKLEAIGDTKGVEVAEHQIAELQTTLDDLTAEADSLSEKWNKNLGDKFTTSKQGLAVAEMDHADELTKKRETETNEKNYQKALDSKLDLESQKQVLERIIKSKDIDQDTKDKLTEKLEDIRKSLTEEIDPLIKTLEDEVLDTSKSGKTGKRRVLTDRKMQKARTKFNKKAKEKTSEDLDREANEYIYGKQQKDFQNAYSIFDHEYTANEKLLENKIKLEHATDETERHMLELEQQNLELAAKRAKNMAEGVDLSKEINKRAQEEVKLKHEQSEVSRYTNLRKNSLDTQQQIEQQTLAKNKLAAAGDTKGVEIAERKIAELQTTLKALDDEAQSYVDKWKTNLGDKFSTSRQGLTVTEMDHADEVTKKEKTEVNEQEYQETLDTKSNLQHKKKVLENIVKRKGIDKDTKDNLTQELEKISKYLTEEIDPKLKTLEDGVLDTSGSGKIDRRRALTDSKMQKARTKFNKQTREDKAEGIEREANEFEYGQQQNEFQSAYSIFDRAYAAEDRVLENKLKIEHAKSEPERRLLELEQEDLELAAKRARNMADGVDLSKDINKHAQEEVKLKHEQIQTNITNHQYNNKPGSVGNVGVGGSFKRSLSMAFRRLFMGFGLSAILMKLTNTLKQLSQEAKILDKTLVNLRIVTGDTESDTRSLINEYSSLARQLGVTTKEVATSATEWLRQGYETSEAMDLIKSSMYLSKLGMIDSASATKDLTSALKGFKIQANDSMQVVDKLTAIDLKAATSAGEIAEGLSKFANLGSLAGVNIDEAAAYVATIADVTQMSGGSAGQALKTIISRYGNVKAGAYNRLNVNAESADQSEDINDVEKVLNKLGIQIRDTTLRFRNFDEVLNEIAGKWDTLDTVSQKAVATTFAGVRQQEAFVTLMQNWDKYEDLLHTSQHSEGTGEKKYTAYKDSYEAAKNELTTSIERLVNNSEFTTILTNLTKVLTTLTDMLPNVLKWGSQLIFALEGVKSLFGKSVIQKLVGKISGTGLFSGFSLKGASFKDRMKAGFGRLFGGEDSKALRDTEAKIQADHKTELQYYNKHRGSGVKKAKKYSDIPTEGHEAYKKHLKDQKDEIKYYNKHRAKGTKRAKAYDDISDEDHKKIQQDIQREKEEKERLQIEKQTTLEVKKSAKLEKQKAHDAQKGARAEKSKKADADKGAKSERQKAREAKAGERAERKKARAADRAARKESRKEYRHSAEGKADIKAGASAALSFAAESLMSMGSTYLTAGETHTNRAGEEVSSSKEAKKAGKAAATAFAAIPVIGPLIDELGGFSNKLMQDIDKARDDADLETKQAQEKLASLHEQNAKVSKLKQLQNDNTTEGMAEREQVAQDYRNDMYKEENDETRELLNHYLQEIADDLGWSNDNTVNFNSVMEDYMNGDAISRERSVKLLELANRKMEHSAKQQAHAKELYHRQELVNQKTLDYRKALGNSGVSGAEGKYHSNGLTTGQNAKAKSIAGAKGLGTGVAVGAGTFGTGVAGAAIAGAAHAAAGAAVSAAIPVVGWIAGALAVAGTAIGTAIWAGVEERKAQREAEEEWNKKDINERREIIQGQQQDARDRIEQLQNQETLTKAEKKELAELEKQTQQGEELLAAYDEQISYIKEIQDENNKFIVDEAMLMAHTQTGPTGQDQFLSDMNIAQLESLGTSKMYDIIAQEVLKAGGLEGHGVYTYSDSHGETTDAHTTEVLRDWDSGQSKYDELSKEDQAIIDNYKNGSYSRQFTDAFLKYAGAATDTDAEMLAAKSGKNRTLRSAVQNLDINDQFDYKILQNFANALHVTVEELVSNKDLLDNFGSLTLSEINAGTSELIDRSGEYLGLLTEITDGTTSASKWMSKITAQFPDLVRYMSDVPTLMSKIMEKIHDLAGAQIQSQWDDYASSKAAYDNGEGEGFKYDIINSGANEEVQKHIADLLTQSGATNLKDTIAFLNTLDQDSEDYELLRKGIEQAGSNIQLTADAYLDALHQYTDFQVSELDKEIDGLNKQKSALQDINHQREYENRLIEAKMRLEEAAEEKKRVYRAGIGFVYEADQSQLQEAQQNLNNVQNEKKVSDIDVMITALQDLRSEITNLWDKHNHELQVQQAEAFEKEFFGINNSISEVGTLLNGVITTESGELVGSVDTAKNVITDTDNHVVGAVNTTGQSITNSNGEIIGSIDTATGVITDKNGEITGTLDAAKNEIVAQDGTIIGKFDEATGQIMNPEGSLVGSINSTTNTIIGTGGEIKGSIDTISGNVMDANGQVIASVDAASGNIISTSGELIGNINASSQAIVDASGSVIGSFDTINQTILDNNSSIMGKVDESTGIITGILNTAGTMLDSSLGALNTIAEKGVSINGNVTIDGFSNMSTMIKDISDMITGKGKNSISVTIANQSSQAIDQAAQNRSDTLEGVDAAWNDYQDMISVDSNGNVTYNTDKYDEDDIIDKQDKYKKAYNDAASKGYINDKWKDEHKDEAAAAQAPDYIRSDYAAIKWGGDYYRVERTPQGSLGSKDRKYIEGDMNSGKDNHAHIWTPNHLEGKDFNGDMSGLPQLDEDETLDHYADKLANNNIREAVIVGNHGSDEWAFLRDGNVYSINKPVKIKENKPKKPTWHYRPKAKGSLGLGIPGLDYMPDVQLNPTLINELGTEAIVTPQGTLTALPSATGIIPADITKNLWSLGAVAPQILSALNGQLPSSVLNRNSASEVTDESINIQSLIMNVDADNSFDVDNFVQAIKDRVALTRNSKH